MKPILSCLLKKAELGRISKTLVSEIEQGINELKLKASSPDAVGELEAAQFIYQEAQARLKNKIAAATTHADLVTSTASRINEGLSKGMSYEQIVRAMTLGDDADTFKFGSLGNSAREEINAYRNYFKSKALKAFENLMPKGFLNLTVDEARQAETIRALFDISKGVKPTTKDALAAEAAQVIDDLHMLGGKMFQDMGGNITLTKGHALNDRSAPEKIAQLGMDEWVTIAKNVYDRDFLGKAFPAVKADDDAWTRALQDRYKSIVSGGLSDIGDYVPSGMRSVMNARNHHRLFRFKDAESYIEYHKQFGDLNIFEATKSYADDVGKDIGLMKSFGPKPQALQNAIVRMVSNKDPAAGPEIQKMLERHMKYVSGTLGGSKDATLDKWLGTMTSLNVAGKLGLTAIDAATVEKLGISKIASSMRGLPLLNTFKEDLKLLVKGSKNREEAFKQLAETALHLEAYIDEGHNVLRTYTQEGGHKFARQAASVVTKATGLNVTTNTTRAASIRAMSMEFGQKTWDQVSPGFRDYFTKLGIDEQVFNTIKEFGTSDIDLGVKGVSVSQLFDAGRHEEAVLLSKAAQRINEAAAPTISPRFLAAMQDKSEGSLGWKLASANFRTFMGYPMSFFDNHYRVLKNMPGLGKQAGAVGAYVTLGTMLGTMSQMIRDTLAGKEPQPDMDTVQRGFGRAIQLPLIGDFLSSPDSGSFGGDLEKRLLGVNLGGAAGLAGSAYKALTADTPSQRGSAIYGATNVLKGFMPGQNTPLLGLLMQRLMFDQMRYLYDPNAEKKFRSTVRRAEKKGKTYWWEPGKTAPEK